MNVRDLKFTRAAGFSLRELSCARALHNPARRYDVAWLFSGDRRNGFRRVPHYSRRERWGTDRDKALIEGCHGPRFRPP